MWARIRGLVDVTRVRMPFTQMRFCASAGHSLMTILLKRRAELLLLVYFINTLLTSSGRGNRIHERQLTLGGCSRRDASPSTGSHCPVCRSSGRSPACRCTGTSRRCITAPWTCCTPNTRPSRCTGSGRTPSSSVAAAASPPQRWPAASSTPSSWLAETSAPSPCCPRFLKRPPIKRLQCYIEEKALCNYAVQSVFTSRARSKEVRLPVIERRPSVNMMPARASPPIIATTTDSGARPFTRFIPGI
jgi:hypothetical protein